MDTDTEINVRDHTDTERKQKKWQKFHHWYECFWLQLWLTVILCLRASLLHRNTYVFYYFKQRADYGLAVIIWWILAKLFTGATFLSPNSHCLVPDPSILHLHVSTARFDYDSGECRKKPSARKWLSLCRSVIHCTAFPLRRLSEGYSTFEHLCLTMMNFPACCCVRSNSILIDKSLYVDIMYCTSESTRKQ